MQGKGGSLAGELLAYPAAEPPDTSCPPADDDVGDILFRCIIQHGRDGIGGCGGGDRAAKLHCKVQRVLDLRVVVSAFNMERNHWRAQGVRQAGSVADHVIGRRICANQCQHALAGRPGTGDRLRPHIGGNILIDPLGDPAQRHLPQGAKIAFAEEPAERAAGDILAVDLALRQAASQFGRRQVDEFDFIGEVEHRIRNGLGNPHAGDAGDRVVQAFQMLDIERGPDIDAGIQDFSHILPAFGVAQAGAVGVGQFIDKQQSRLSAQCGVQVELLQLLAAIGDLQPGQRFEWANLLDCPGPAMGFDKARDNVDAGFAFMVGGDQHFPGFADTRGRRRGKFSNARGFPGAGWRGAHRDRGGHRGSF